MATTLTPEDILRVLREGPKTVSQTREALGLPEVVPDETDRWGGPIWYRDRISQALQKLKKAGQVRLSGNIWSLTGTATHTVVIPSGKYDALKQAIGKMSGKVLT